MSKVIFITLEKSGSQWVRDVLCDPAIAACGGFPSAGVSFNMSVTGDFTLPDRQFSGPVYGMNRVEWLAAAGPGDKALVVVRDPRDRMVSLLFSWLYSHAPNPFVEYSKSRLAGEGMSRDDQLMWIIGETAMHIRFYLSWTRNLPDNAYLLRYETLLQAQRAEYGKLLDWLGWQVPEDTLARVVEAHSFARKSARSGGEEDRSSHLRRGVAGDWQNHFTRKLGMLWESLYPGFLAAIGYEADADWWMRLPEDAAAAPASGEILIAGPREIELQLALEHKDRELQQKEQVIRTLDQACRERLALLEAQQARIAELQAAAAARPDPFRLPRALLRKLAAGRH